MAAERHDTAFVVGAIMGGLAGAAVTLFNVPRSGAETRAQLGKLTQGLTDPARRLSDDVQGRVVGTLIHRSSQAEDEPATPIVVAPELKTGPLDPVGIEPAAAVLAEAPLSGGGQIDIVIDGPRPADPASQG